MQELNHLATSKESVFPFSTQVDDSADHVTATNRPATTQFKGRAKLTERQKKGADKCITKVTETFELKKVAEGNRRFRRSKQTSSQPLLYALMSGINLCKSQSSRQWEILIQQARIYRAWLPSEIYSLLLSPILDNTIFRNDFRGQPRAVNSGELHGNLILC